MDIITRKGWLNSITMTNEHPDFGTAYAVVKGYTPERDGATQAATNLEIVVRRPNGQQALVYVLAENDGYTYPAGVPVSVVGKAGPSSCGWRTDGDLEIAANVRQENPTRQAWGRVVLKCVEGKWGEI